MKDDLRASLKMWDIRKATTPVQAWKDASLCNFNQATNIAVSPNERIVLTGSSVRKGLGHYSLLNGFDTLTGDLVCKEAVLEKDQSLSVVNWCNASNQIYLGTSSGEIKVLYDAGKSRGGIMKCISKQARTKRSLKEGQFSYDEMIFNPSEILD